MRAAAEQLGRSVTADPSYFDEVFYKLEIPEINNHALYLLSYDDLKRLALQLRVVEPWMDSIATGLPQLLQRLGSLPRAQARASLQPLFPLLLQLLTGLNQSLESRGQAPYVSPLPAFRPESPMLREHSYRLGQTTFYNVVQSDRSCLMLVRPSDRSGSFWRDAATVARLRWQASQTMRAFPGVECLVCGEKVLNTDEMVSAYNDTSRLGAAALVLIYAVLCVAFADLVRPLCAMLSLGVGLSWSVAFASVMVDSLNLLTVHFATIVTGLSMTFAVQLLCHYLERGAQEPEEKRPRLLMRTMADVGPASFVGALTTAIAFESLHFTNFRAAAELGLITGVGVILCFFSITTVLPVLLQLSEGRKPCRPVRLFGWRSWAQPIFRHPWAVLALSLVTSLYCLTWVVRVPFNYNMLSLQPQDSEAVRVEKFLQSKGYSALVAVTSAASIQEAYLLTQKFEALSSVSRVDSVAALQPQRVDQKRPLVKAIVDLARPLKLRPLATNQAHLSASELIRLRVSFGQASSRLQSVLEQLPPGEQRRTLQTQLSKLEGLLDPRMPGPVSAALLAYQGKLAQDMHKETAFLSQQSQLPPDILGSLPQALRERSVSADGRVCVRIFPRANCWEREPLEFFVHQLQQTDPQVTGSPLLIYYYIQELRQAYATSGRNALLVIFLLLLLHFRSWSNALLAICPKLLGVLWMIGIMGVTGESFNSANFLALPITLGIGLIFGVNVLLECQTKGAHTLFSGPTGGSVAVSGLTAILGFSSFILASHIGVSSFGFLMAAGLAANLLTSLFTLPALLTVLGRSPGAQADAQPPDQQGSQQEAENHRPSLAEHVRYRLHPATEEVAEGREKNHP